MICPKCKIVYEEGVTECTQCGESLVPDDFIKAMKNMDWFTGFGVTTAKRAISALFFLGLVPLFYASILFGKFLYQTNMCSKEISYIQDGKTWYTSEQVNDSSLGIFGGIIFFVILMFIWKVLCELLIIIFRAIEMYSHKNSTSI